MILVPVSIIQFQPKMVLTGDRVNAGAEVEPSCREDNLQPTPVNADAASKNRHWNQFRLNLAQAGCRDARWQGGVSGG